MKDKKFEKWGPYKVDQRQLGRLRSAGGDMKRRDGFFHFKAPTTKGLEVQCGYPDPQSGYIKRTNTYLEPKDTVKYTDMGDLDLSFDVVKRRK